MNAEVEAYAEKMVRDEWMRKLNEHGNSRCQKCGHSGWAHGQKGCVVFREDTPTKDYMGVKVVNLPDDARMEDYFCGCQSELCKTNEQIIWA